MLRIPLLLALFAVSALPLPAVDVVVNSVPGDARFVNYGAIDWKGAPNVSASLTEFTAAVSKSTMQVRNVASRAGADLVVLICPQTGVVIPQSVVRHVVRLREKDPVLVAAFYKMNAGRKASPQEESVCFTTTLLARTQGVSVDMKIERGVDTAGVTLSYWVYMNLPRFVAEAAEKHLDTITIKSSEDAECEDVWLPGCDDPLRVSKKKPLIDCSIYNRRANKSLEPTATPVTPRADARVAPAAAVAQQ